MPCQSRTPAREWKPKPAVTSPVAVRSSGSECTVWRANVASMDRGTRVAESDKRAAEGELRERQRTDDLRGEASDIVLEAQEAVGKERWQDAKVLAASALAKIGSEPSLAGLQAQAQVVAPDRRA